MLDHPATEPYSILSTLSKFLPVQPVLLANFTHHHGQLQIWVLIKLASMAVVAQ
jgi:hypothetical protein